MLSFNRVDLTGKAAGVLHHKKVIVDANQCFTHAQMDSCAACGSRPSITRESLAHYDYEAFTGQPAHDGEPTPLALLPAAQRISPMRLADLMARERPPTIVDVRPPQQYDMAHLPGKAHGAHAALMLPSCPPS